MKNALKDDSALHKTTLFMIIQKVLNIIKLCNRKALKMLVIWKTNISATFTFFNNISN